MTIITFRDGVLAADTLVTHNGTRVSHAQKIFRVGDWLIGACGTFGGIKPVEAWVKAGADLDTAIDFGKVEDTGAILVGPSGKTYHADTGGGYVCEELSPFLAIGSGSEIALGAMYHGATAIEAVNAAIALETNCGGQIFWLGVNGTSNVNSLQLE